MTTFSKLYAKLRKKNIQHYSLLFGCCFFSVLLITAYVCMMRSPTVLNVLPEGGDSRKQVMMIFVLAVLGCAVFTTYASGLFFRYKSRETGIFMALGASRRQLMTLLTRELALISLASCGAGILLGAPLAWVIWRLFRLLLVDTEEMALTLDPQALLFALAFSLFVILMLFFMLVRFIRRTNIMDVVNESRKSEPIQNTPRWYGPVGIALLVFGALLGYLTPGFCVNVLHWYPPEGLTAITYLPALIGLYMILLHTVANGWRQGKNRYKNLVGTSMMKFQGRQTVRNMLVITVLVAGAYFAAFYTPMLGTGAMMSYDARKADYVFHHQVGQDMPDEAEIRDMAAREGVTITDYAAQPAVILGVDGTEQVETSGGMGITYTVEYRRLLGSDVFLSESAYNALTGDSIDVAPGHVTTIYDDEGGNGYRAEKDIRFVTNVVTGQVLEVTPDDEVIRNAVLLGCHILDDGDYAGITAGLTEDWRETWILFNVEDVDQTYDFAKGLFYEIVDRSGPETQLDIYWDPVQRLRSDQADQPYWADPEVQAAQGYETVNLGQRDSFNFRSSWKYMPQFRVLDRADYVKTLAVFLMLFIFIALVCFAAVIVITYTRSITIGLTNAQVYTDIRRLGGSNSYLFKTVQGQISKVYSAPIATGTLLIFAFYTMIMYFNDGAFTLSELAGLASCAALVGVLSLLLYFVYRITLNKVCGLLEIRR